LGQKQNFATVPPLQTSHLRIAVPDSRRTAVRKNWRPKSSGTFWEPPASAFQFSAGLLLGSVLCALCVFAVVSTFSIRVVHSRFPSWSQKTRLLSSNSKAKTRRNTVESSAAKHGFILISPLAFCIRVYLRSFAVNKMNASYLHRI
jgi:hypothetical protein